MITTIAILILLTASYYRWKDKIYTKEKCLKLLIIWLIFGLVSGYDFNQTSGDIITLIQIVIPQSFIFTGISIILIIPALIFKKRSKFLLLFEFSYWIIRFLTLQGGFSMGLIGTGIELNIVMYDLMAIGLRLFILKQYFLPQVKKYYSQGIIFLTLILLTSKYLFFPVPLHFFGSNKYPGELIETGLYGPDSLYWNKYEYYGDTLIFYYNEQNKPVKEINIGDIDSLLLYETYPHAVTFTYYNSYDEKSQENTYYGRDIKMIKNQSDTSKFPPSKIVYNYDEFGNLTSTYYLSFQDTERMDKIEYDDNGKKIKWLEYYIDILEKDTVIFDNIKNKVIKIILQITRDDSQLAHPVHQDKDVKETTTYKSTNILRNKRQLAISRERVCLESQRHQNIVL